MEYSQCLKDTIDFFIDASNLKEVFIDCKKIEDAIAISIYKAYGDAKRTFKDIGKYDGEKQCAIDNVYKLAVEYFKLQRFPDSMKSFDKYHETMCEAWSKPFSVSNLKAYGKAQKIVNMMFKYMYCWYYLNQDKLSEDAFKYCHMTLDSYTLDWIYDNFEKKPFKKNVTWSNWSKEDYLFITEKSIEAYSKNFGNQHYTILEAEFIILPR